MAALRAAVFPLSAKNRRGGHFFAPPSSARVNGNAYKTHGRRKMISCARWLSRMFDIL